MKGEVIGINFAIFSPTGASVGVGFAVPSSAAKNIIDQLMKTGKVHHGWLGVVIQSTADITEGLGIEDGKGALVTSVARSSPAEKAGIQIGDIILKFDGKEITTNKKLPRIVSETPIGKKVSVELMSKGKKKTISLVVGEIDGKLDLVKNNNITNDKNIYGMNLSPITEEIKHSLNLKSNVTGIIVLRVEKKSIAAKYGIKRGDIINSVNQQPISKVDDFISLVEESKKMQRKSVMLQIYRTGRVLFLNIPIL
jgi:serine protease Do